MDTAIYIGAAVVIVAWSVWAYLAWSDKAGLADTGTRFLLIIGPSGYFVLMALVGWRKALFLRLDLFGICALVGLSLLAWFLLLLLRVLRVRNFRRGYITVLTAYNLLALSLVILAHLVKLFPPLLIRFSSLIQQWSEIDFFKFAWIGLDPETHETDMVSMLNKVVIALLSYIPISILRAVYVNRRHRRMMQEIDNMKGKIEELERKIAGSGS